MIKEGVYIWLFKFNIFAQISNETKNINVKFGVERR